MIIGEKEIELDEQVNILGKKFKSSEKVEVTFLVNRSSGAQQQIPIQHTGYLIGIVDKSDYYPNQRTLQGEFLVMSGQNPRTALMTPWVDLRDSMTPISLELIINVAKLEYKTKR